MNRADHPVRPETAYLVDASIYIFRAWHTLPDQFVDPAGRPTNAVYGFARFLCDLIEKTGAMHVAVYSDGWYEADDLIASLAAGCKSRQQAVCVVSGDKDLAQGRSEERRVGRDGTCRRRWCR